jgi:hypothetical protein
MAISKDTIGPRKSNKGWTQKTMWMELKGIKEKPTL